MKHTRLSLLLVLSVVVASVLLATTAHASGGAPWEGPLDKLLRFLTGRTAVIIGGLSVAGVGIALAASEGGAITRKGVAVVIGIAVVMNAPGLVFSLFGAGSGASL